MSIFFNSSLWAATSPAPVQWDLDALCKNLRIEMKKLGWAGLEPCNGFNWKIGGKSVEGRPLIYAEFGDATGTNSTLIFSMVHGDEITPLYQGFQLAHWLRESQEQLKGIRVVLAPFVNPDGFFKAIKTRVNARGVDLNRNFATADFKKSAIEAWKKKFRKDPRRYPGTEPASEPETIFQNELMDKVKPQKILSIHAPLHQLDYDGPNTMLLKRFSKNYVQECLKMKSRLRAVSSGFFPGSLGNYAGQERGIPTITLELPSATPRHAHVYWEKFHAGMKTMIEFRIPDLVSNNP